MGSLIRIILIFAIVYYLIKKVGGFFYRTVAGSSGQNQGNASRQRYSSHQKREGEIRVEKAPNNKKPATNFKGGEYVDFEEVE